MGKYAVLTSLCRKIESQRTLHWLLHDSQFMQIQLGDINRYFTVGVAVCQIVFSIRCHFQ